MELVFWRALAEQAISDEPDEPSKPIRFVASTEGRKADGMDLKAGDWRLDRYLNHPVVLFAHDYFGSHLPVGRGSPFFRGSDLMIDVHFDVDDPFAMTLRNKARKGLVGGSVGWQTASDGGNELIEFSIVPVPLDPKALPERSLRALTDLGHQLAELVGNPDQDQGDGESRGVDQLERIGATLSSRNRSDIEQALGLLQAVLDRSSKTEQSASEDDSRGDSGGDIFDPDVLARLMNFANKD